MRTGWKMVKMKDVAPASPSKAECPDPSKVWNLTLDQIESGTGKISNRQYITESEASSSTNFVDGANVLYSKLRPYLNKVVVPDSFACATSELVPLKPDPDRLDKSFLVHYLRSKQFVTWASNAVAGAKMPRLNMKEFWQHEFPLPPMEEQRRIVEILDAAQALIDKRKEQIALMDELIQSLFYDMFGDPVTNPMGWEMTALGKLVDVRDGTHDSPKYVVEGYPLVTSKNVTDGKLDLSSCQLISEEDYLSINKRSAVHKGDIIMPMIGTIGNPLLIMNEPNFAIKNVALLKFQEQQDVLNVFVLHLLKSPYFKHVTAQISRGGTQKFISLGNIRSIPTPTPSLSLQTEFAKRVEKIDAQKTAMESSLLELDNNFNSLMQRAFKGDLVNE